MVLAESLILILWTIVSIYILRRIGFFSAAPLNRAPERQSNLGLLMFGGAILFYFCLLVIAVSANQYGPTASSPLLNARDQAAQATQPATAVTNFRPIQDNIILQAAVGLVTVVVILMAAHRMTIGGIHAFGINPQVIPRGLAVGLLALFLMAPWMIQIQILVAHLGEQIRGGPLPVHPILEMLRNSPPTALKWILVVNAIVIAPFVEEIIFRGLLQTALLRYFPRIAPARWLSIAIASVIFTSVHFQSGPHGVNWEHFPPLFLLSLTLGYLYERTGSLWPNIVLHGLFNASATAMTLLMIDAK